MKKGKEQIDQQWDINEAEKTPVEIIMASEGSELVFSSMNCSFSLFLKGGIVNWLWFSPIILALRKQEQVQGQSGLHSMAPSQNSHEGDE